MADSNPKLCECGCGLPVVPDKYGWHQRRYRINHDKKIANRKHGMWGTPEWRAWRNARDRCTNHGHRQWRLYGGRGISVCDRWLKFQNFFADMGRRPPGTSLDRINNAGNYEPSNCRWTNSTTQNNNRSDNIRVTMGAETKTISQWARHLGVPPHRIYNRILRGWDPVRALTEPPQEKYRH